MASGTVPATLASSTAAMASADKRRFSLSKSVSNSVSVFCGFFCYYLMNFTIFIKLSLLCCIPVSTYFETS